MQVNSFNTNIFQSKPVSFGTKYLLNEHQHHQEIESKLREQGETHVNGLGEENLNSWINISSSNGTNMVLTGKDADEYRSDMAKEGYYQAKSGKEGTTILNRLADKIKDNSHFKSL